MKPSIQEKACLLHGFTFGDLIVTLGVLAVVALVVLPMTYTRPHRKSERIRCVSNLKNIGLATRIYATDHDDRFTSHSLEGQFNVQNLRSKPMDYYWNMFRVLSNQLSTPKLMVCGKDEATKPAEDWASLTGTNLSYFLGLNADELKLDSILSGDKNIAINGLRIRNMVVGLNGVSKVGWTEEIHHFQGNIGLVDGSVQQASNNRFRTALSHAASYGNPTTWLAVP